MRKRNLVWAGVLVLGALISFPEGLNYAGYCASQKRFLPDAEKIRIAVDYTNGSSVIPVQVNGHETRLYKAVMYKDADDLIRQNPNCCRITVAQRSGDEPPPPSFLSRVLGLYVGDVRIDYTAHYLDERGDEHTHLLRRIVLLGNCGAITN